MPHQANIDRFAGFAGTYDSARPRVPAVIVDILTQLAGVVRPALVVDIGCGTGLSTRIWADRSLSVIGIEPSADMRAQAIAATTAGNVKYKDGDSAQTHLPDQCADIVTVSQALHWMEPEPTFAEIARILRHSGVFAVIDYDTPPAMNWQMEQAYIQFTSRIDILEKQHGVASAICRYGKSEHLSRIAASGRFRFTREILVHHEESGNAQRLMRLARSLGGVATLLKMGLSENDIGLTDLQSAADQHLGPAPIPWYVSYRVRIGIK